MTSRIAMTAMNVLEMGPTGSVWTLMSALTRGDNDNVNDSDSDPTPSDSLPIPWPTAGPTRCAPTATAPSPAPAQGDTRASWPTRAAPTSTSAPTPAGTTTWGQYKVILHKTRRLTLNLTP